MPTVTVTTRDGQSRPFEATSGRSLMENLRSNGVDELLALCGGCLSCATCHVYVEQDWLPRLPPMGDDEDDLLDSAEQFGIGPNQMSDKLLYQGYGRHGGSL